MNTEVVETATTQEVTFSAADETAIAPPMIEEAVAPETSVIEAPPADETPVEPASLVANPETVAEEDTGKRRRTRGGGTGSRAAARKLEAKTEEDTAAAPETPPSDDPPRPQLMDSAEHRTTGPDEPNANDDDLLFFPKAKKHTPLPPPPPPEPESISAPEPVFEYRVEEARIEEPAPMAEPEAIVETKPFEEPTYEPMPRQRRRDVRSHGSVEDDLAADPRRRRNRRRCPGWRVRGARMSGNRWKPADFEGEMPEEVGEAVPRSRVPGTREEPRRDDRRGGPRGSGSRS